MSYRFYDPIIRMAQETMCKNLKEHFRMKHILNLQRIDDDKSLGRKLFEKISSLDFININDNNSSIFKYPQFSNIN